MAKILVVDDEIGIRELLSDILSDEGYTIYTAENAKTARALVDQTQFDLILLDIWMPDTDGVSLLKEWEAHKKVLCPVIMMSGHATIETAVEATKFGAMAFLEKPIAMRRLLDTVTSGLEASSRLSFLTKKTAPSPCESKKPQLSQLDITSLPKLEVPGTGICIDFSLSLKEVKETAERAYLVALMKYESCQMTRVARHAGLERTHLYRKLKSLNMDVPRCDKSAAEQACDESDSAK